MPLYPQCAFTFRLFVLFVVVCVSPLQADEIGPAAAETPPEPEVKWSGEVELGYVQTSGNTRTQSATFKFKLLNEWPKWHHRADLEAYSAHDKDTTTAESYKLEMRSEYLLREVDYLFGLLRYEDDRFAGYDRRTTEVAGYGYRLFKMDKFRWHVEVGAGARQSRLITDEQIDEALWRLGTNLWWGISKTSEFSQELFIEDGDKNRFTDATSELKVKVNSSLALKLAYNLKNNSVVPVGTQHTNSKTTVTLSYDF